MSPIPGSSLGVLVVDDDAAVARLVAVVLGELGVTQVRIAEDGDQALKVDVGPESGIDLVISDLQMPKLDGIAYLRHLKARGYQGAVVLMSGGDTRLLKAVEGFGRSLSLTLIGILEKPIRRADLAKLLDRLRAQKAGAGPAKTVDVSVEELRRAIAGQEIDVYYQPQADATTRKVTGAEALARWIHPEKGFIPPNVFIPLAEEHDLIDALAEQVLVKAMTAARDWRTRHRDLNVSVNLSFRNLRRLSLPEEIEERASALDLPLNKLVLEITESSFVSHVSTTLEILTRLRLKGAGLSIDDFGTGYATLDHLQQIPFTELKIDRGFVNAAPHDPTARTILESSVYLARRLGMTTVAEGVETAEEWALVVEIGVHSVQGYALARPMPTRDFLPWLTKHSAEIASFADPPPH